MAFEVGQRRHFMCTLWPVYKEPTPERMGEVKDFLSGFPDLSFIAYQWERTAEGQLHIQLYIETRGSKRATSIAKFLKLLPDIKVGMVQFRKHARERCKLYVSKDESRVENTEPVFIGVWRPDKKSNQRAKLESCADLIKEGYDAAWIAYHRPELYLRYGNKIEACINRRQLHHERQQLLAEREEYEEE